eukprot:257926-Chlamydomonas_euryale.AAC.6
MSPSLAGEGRSRHGSALPPSKWELPRKQPNASAWCRMGSHGSALRRSGSLHCCQQWRHGHWRPIPTPLLRLPDLQMQSQSMCSRKAPVITWQLRGNLEGGPLLNTLFQRRNHECWGPARQAVLTTRPQTLGPSEAGCRASCGLY